MFSKQFIAAALSVLPAFADSSLVYVRKSKNPIPGLYIVTFKDHVNRDAGISSLVSKFSNLSTITHKWDILNGFSGNFTNTDLDLMRSDSNVVSIEEDGYVYTQAKVHQTNATWGLGRISSQGKFFGRDDTALTFDYHYDASAGANSDVYIIDTGIFTSHPAFGGRASWGATFGRNYTNVDGNGHGTHCAGTAVSGPYGVAKSANVIAVKVMADNGTGSWSDIISGMDWVAGAVRRSGRPSVASMSITGNYSQHVNDAAANLVSSGVTTIAAAGNSNKNVINFSPPSTPSVITVGASNITDARYGYSNYGSLVDIWAPGTHIISTWNNSGTNMLSGTSMAASHVAGYAAYLLTLDSALTPATVLATIKSQALKNTLTGIPVDTTNRLLYNGYGSVQPMDPPGTS